jgi:hypothetical protein
MTLLSLTLQQLLETLTGIHFWLVESLAATAKLMLAAW